MMSKAGAKFYEVKELLMKDEEFKMEYEKLKPRYDVISQIIEAYNTFKKLIYELGIWIDINRNPKIIFVFPQSKCFEGILYYRGVYHKIDLFTAKLLCDTIY